MNKIFSLEQKTKTGDLNADLIMRQNKLDKMADSMEIKSINQKMKRPEVAKELAISTSTLQRYRREINMHYPSRKLQSSNIHTTKEKASNHIEPDLKMTSNDLKMTSNLLKEPQKNLLKIGIII